jgi:uncharacterized protein YgiM (DUF1202 family)
MKMKRWVALAMGMTICLAAEAQTDLTATNAPATSDSATAKKTDTVSRANRSRTPKKATAAPTKKKEAKPAMTAEAPSETAAKAEGRVPIDPPENALVKQDHVNVRGQSGLAGEVITRLRKGEPVTLLEEINLKSPRKDEPGKWFKIVMPTNTPVWVNAEFVDPETKAIKATRLNVRAGPGENFSVVDRLEKGVTVKEIRKVNNWMEIETPAGAFAFVAADMIARPVTSVPTVTSTPPPRMEVVSTPPSEKIVPANPNPTPTPAPTTTPPTTTAAPVEKPVETTAPVIASPPPAPVEQAPVKRIVTRDGIVRTAISIQSPTYFALQNAETGRTMNYVRSENHPEYKLERYKGFRIIVTGEEFIDPRWPTVPVIEIDSLDLP